MISLTAFIASSALLSCSTLAIGSQEPKGQNTGNGFPLSRASGSSGSGQSSDGNHGGDSGSMDHGLEGDRWQDRVPREPMWVINPGSGPRNSSVNPEDNAFGYANWWRGDRAVDELLIRIRRGYDVGARWFLINRPMGTPGNTYVPGASWLTLDKERREKIPELLTDALLDDFAEPVHIVWFIGSDMSDPRSYPGWTPNRDGEFFQLGKDDNWEQLIGTRVTLGGWISTGASGIAIDNSAPVHKRSHYRRLFEQLSQFPFHLSVYGEAYPIKLDDRGRVAKNDRGEPLLDQEFVNSMPWIAASDYIDSHWPVTASTEVCNFDPNETRMYIWMIHSAMSYGSENSRRALINSYMDRGLIPITADPVMFTEALNRLRSSQQSQRSTSMGNGTRSHSSSGQRSAQSSAARNSQSQRSQLPSHLRPKVKGIR